MSRWGSDGCLHDGDTHTLRAIPTNEYRFVEWRKWDDEYEDYEVVSTERTYTFVAQKEETSDYANYTALFVSKKPVAPEVTTMLVGYNSVAGTCSDGWTGS